MKPHMGTLLRACGKGSQDSCTIAKKIHAMYAGSVITFTDASKDLATHPNKLPFKAVLLICDEPSDKPPHGAQGHRILVTKEVAKKKIGGLPGMAVNYDPGDMDEHKTQHKVGVITKAWMEGPEVKIAGFIWKKDFPEAERDLKRKDLGTSMELADVYVDNENASVWELTDFSFTGATILKRNAAAYTKTSLAANAVRAVKASLAALKDNGEGEREMSKKVKEESKRRVAAARDGGRNGDLALITQAIAGSIGPALTAAIGPIVNEIKAANQRTQESMEELKGLHMIQAAGYNGDDDEDESDEEVVLHAAKEDDDSDDMAAGHEDDDSDDMAAAKKSDESDDDSDDMAAAKSKSDDDSSDDGDDSSEDASLDAMEDLELEEADEEPGEVNKGAKNKGSKKTVTKPPTQGEHFSGNVAKGRLHSSGKKGSGMKKPFPGLAAAAEQLRTIHASNRKLKRTIKAQAIKYEKKVVKLRNTVDTMNAQLEHFAEIEGRRSTTPVELINLAAKSGIDLRQVKASGDKFTVEAVDRMFANGAAQGILLTPEQRIGMKLVLEQEGMMDNGEIDRGYGRSH